MEYCRCRLSLYICLSIWVPILWLFTLLNIISCHLWSAVSSWKNRFGDPRSLPWVHCCMNSIQVKEFLTDSQISRSRTSIVEQLHSWTWNCCPLLFSMMSPAVGSAAAGWQVSIRAVEAGSLFVLCQSVVMGGVTAAGLATTGVSSTAVALAAWGLPSPLNLSDIFTTNSMKGPWLRECTCELLLDRTSNETGG